MSAFDDRRLLVRAAGALLLANIRFWPTVAPLLGAQLKHWRARAQTIGDPRLKTLALKKLRDERFNAEVAATLATLAPRRHRANVVQAIVAYEVMYDYLDGLTEQPSPDPLRTGHELYRPFIDAIEPTDTPRDSRPGPNGQDDRYPQELARTVQASLAQLPTANAIRDTARQAATRCAEAQIRAHAAPSLGTPQLQAWATKQTAGTQLSWQEFLAGAASSVLAVHALIATAADHRTTPADARQIDAAYLSICALSTMLDSLIDYERDTQTGDDGYLRYYESHEQLASDLTHAAHRAAQHAAQLRDGSHHTMTLVGVAAYYLSAPTATTPFALPVTRCVRRELQPLITPTLAVMRAWRLAKRVRGGLIGAAAGHSAAS